MIRGPQYELRGERVGEIDRLCVRQWAEIRVRMLPPQVMRLASPRWSRLGSAPGKPRRLWLWRKRASGIGRGQLPVGVSRHAIGAGVSTEELLARNVPGRVHRAVENCQARERSEVEPALLGPRQTPAKANGVLRSSFPPPGVKMAIGWRVAPPNPLRRGKDPWAHR